MGPPSVIIPADLSGEDVFLPLGPVKMSLRQTVTCMGAFFLWFGGARFGVQPLLHLQVVWSLMFLGWIPLLGLALSFLKVRGRPVDVWFGDYVSFRFGARTFVLRDLERAGAVQADLYHDPDLEVMQREWRRHGLHG